MIHYIHVAKRYFHLNIRKEKEMENRYEMYHILIKANSLNRIKLEKLSQFFQNAGELEFLTVGNTVRTVATDDPALADASYADLIAAEGTLDSNGCLRVSVCEWVQITALCRPSCWESIKALKLW